MTELEKAAFEYAKKENISFSEAFIRGAEWHEKSIQKEKAKKRCVNCLYLMKDATSYFDGNGPKCTYFKKMFSSFDSIPEWFTCHAFEEKK